MTDDIKPIDNGGPAFPFVPLAEDGLPLHAGEFGMSLRDWFAGQALQGVIAAVPNIMTKTLDGSTSMAEVIATAAYQTADAMIKARGQ